MNDLSNNGQWAVFYNSIGLRVHPLAPKTKDRPLWDEWQNRATADQSITTETWLSNPNANIAVAPGAGFGGHFVILDTDVKDDVNGEQSLAEWCAENNVTLPPTATYRTGRGGLHRWYMTPWVLRSRTNVLPAVDTRGEGGYTVVPPSLHPNGKFYEWLPGLSLADFPGGLPTLPFELLAFLSPEGNSGFKPPLETPESIPDGTRNDTMFRLACQQRALGLTYDEILHHMEKVNETRCDPPLDEEELQVICKQAAGYKQEQNKIIALARSQEGGDFNTDDPPWVHQTQSKQGKITTKILCSVLADYIRKNSRYIFVRDNVLSGVQRFFYTQGYYKQISDDEMQGFIKAFIPLEHQRMCDICEVQGLLYSDLNFVPYDRLNPENVICFQNGLLSTDTWQMKPHSPDYLCTIQIPCDYVANVPSPPTGYFDNYMRCLTSDNDENIRLILQFMGVALSNVRGYRMKKALFMTGEGDTGKSQIKKLLARIVGAENNSAIDLTTLEQRFGTSQILNKRLAGSNDMSYMTVTELQNFKQATGGDDLYAEIKGKHGFNFTFNGVLWFCCNRLPKFGGDKGDWVYERVLALECNNVIPLDQQDKQLDEHLYSEREYAVSLAIEALKRVIARGYNYDIPASSLLVNAEYKVENNSFLRFMRECTEEREKGIIGDWCTCKRFYDVYVAWCKDNNKGYAESKKDIKRMLDRERKGDTKKRDGYDCFSDFTLTQSTKLDYQEYYRVWEETSVGVL